MADVFADLVANIRIDTANFDKQLSTIKSQLSGFSAASLGNITLKSLESELDNIQGELSGLEGKAKTSSDVIQDRFDKLNTDKARSELDLLKDKYTAIGNILDDVMPEAGGAFSDGIKDIIQKSDEASKSIKKTADATKKLGTEGTKNLKKVEVGFSGIVGKALKAVAVMGAVELALGGVNTLSKFVTGEWEDAAEAAKQLPAGIGPVATQLEGVLNLLTRWKDQADSIKRTTGLINELLEAKAGLQARAEGVALANAMRELDIYSQLGALRLKDDDDMLARQQEFAAGQQRTLQLQSEIAASNLSFAQAQAGYSSEVSKIQEEISKKKTLRDGTSREASKQAYQAEIDALKAKQAAMLAVLNIQKKEKENLENLVPILEELNELSAASVVDDIAKKASEEFKELLGTFEDLNKEFKDFSSDITFENQISGMTEVEQSIEKVKKAADEEAEAAKEMFKELKEAAAAAGTTVDDADLTKTLGSIRIRQEQEIALIKEQAAADEKAANEKLAEKRFAREKGIANLRSSIIQSQLKLDGKDVEAKIEGLKNKFAQDFLNAKTLVEKGLLGQQLALDIQEAEKVETKEPERQDIRGRFEDTVAKLVGSDKDAKIARAQERKERREMRQLATLEAIRDIAKDNKELLGDIDFDPRFQ